MGERRQWEERDDSSRLESCRFQKLAISSGLADSPLGAIMIQAEPCEEQPRQLHSSPPCDGSAGFIEAKGNYDL